MQLDSAVQSGDRIELIKSLGLRDVVAMTLVGVVSLRWIARAARMGAPSTVLWVLAAVFFLLPLASAVRTLSSRFPDQGGLYAWTRRALGPTHGFICGWCLWVNNLFYYPSLLLFAAANVPPVFGGRFPGLADSRLFSAIFVLGVLWLLVGLNIAGLSSSKRLQNFGSVGTWLPAALLIAFGIIAFHRFGSATSFAVCEITPSRGFLDTVGVWSAMCFAFSGLELTSLVGQEVRNPDRTIPLGIVIAGSIVAIIYIAGTVSLLVSVPASALVERSGIADAIGLASGRIGLGGFGALAGFLLAFGSVATCNSWFAGAARVPFAAGVDRALPAAFARIHPRFRTPYVVLILQGIAASLIFLASLFVTVAGSASSLQEAYDILVNLTILIYFLPYLYLFLSLIRLDCRRMTGERRQLENTPRKTAISGRKAELWLVAATGGLATAISLGLVFVPPAGTANVINYELNVIGQSAVILAVGLILYRRAGKRREPPHSDQEGVHRRTASSTAPTASSA